MFTIKVFRVLFLCLTLIGLSVPNATAQRKKQIAVLNFDFATVDIGLARHAYGNQENLAITISDKLINSLVSQNTCVVIERSRLERVLREQNLGIEGRIDPSTAAKVGRILGVDALIIGNVSVFDLQGMPKDSRDTMWTPDDLRARIAVNYRVVNTTTAVIEASNEVTGVSAAASQTASGEKLAKTATTGMGALGGLIGNNKLGRILRKGGSTNEPVKVKDEEIRNVVQLAVDDVVNQVTVGVEGYLSGARRQPEAPVAEKQINGRVIDANGPTVFITGINKSAVHIGDRLFVRRTRIKSDPVTGKEVRISDKIGEVEIVEIQDEAVVGSFSGSVPVQEGDAVTNNPGAVGAPVRQPQSLNPGGSSSPAKTAPTPGKTPNKSPQRPAKPRPGI